MAECDEPEPLELSGLLKERVRADEHFDRAGCEHVKQMHDLVFSEPRGPALGAKLKALTT